ASVTLVQRFVHQRQLVFWRLKQTHRRRSFLPNFFSSHWLITQDRYAKRLIFLRQRFSFASVLREINLRFRPLQFFSGDDFPAVFLRNWTLWRHQPISVHSTAEHRRAGHWRHHHWRPSNL